MARRDDAPRVRHSGTSHLRGRIVRQTTRARFDLDQVVTAPGRAPRRVVANSRGDGTHRAEEAPQARWRHEVAAAVDEQPAVREARRVVGDHDRRARHDVGAYGVNHQGEKMVVMRHMRHRWATASVTDRVGLVRIGSCVLEARCNLWHTFAPAAGRVQRKLDQLRERLEPAQRAERGRRRERYHCRGGA